MSKSLDLKTFLATAELPDLGPGPRAGVESQSSLQKQLRQALSASELSDERHQLIQALVLLWHDHLEAAHGIAQNVEGPDGALVHGIMHRREPDFGNAAYWFRRAGRHAAFPLIAGRVAAMLDAVADQGLAAKLVPNGVWSPFAFIDACEEASRQARARQSELQRVQRAEFLGLLDWLQAD